MNSPIHLELIVNGVHTAALVDTRVTLLDFLREEMNLTGAKKGCDHGQCGACTVLVDGRRMVACLKLLASVGGCSVTTIEGVAKGGAMHPIQVAFMKHDAFQCGFCTSGQIMSAIEVVADHGAGTACAVREQMSGNLCRCGAYPNIVSAILEVKRDATV